MNLLTVVKKLSSKSIEIFIFHKEADAFSSEGI